MIKPVMYLDVDGVLISFDMDGATGANHAGPFLQWALEHFEVRWLTTWAIPGIMRVEQKQRLAVALDVPYSVVCRVHPGKPWWKTRSLGVTWEDSRPFVWIEDGILDNEQEDIDNCPHAHYFYSNCFDNADALKITQNKLRTWLDTVWTDYERNL